jgi:hypothetical protein
MAQKSSMRNVPGGGNVLTIWKSFHSNPDEAREFRVRGSKRVRELLALITKTRSEDVAFVIVSPADLGCRENPRTTTLLSDEFLAVWSIRRKLLGRIALCQSGDIVLLRKRYADQPEGEVLWLGMHPLEASNRRKYVLGLSHHAQRLEICERSANPENEWEKDHWILFRFIPTLAKKT